MHSFRNADVELTCPHCARKFKKRLGELEKNPSTTCPGCGKAVTVDTKGVSAQLTKLSQSLSKFGRG